MIIDSHQHVVLPPEKQLQWMAEGSIDKVILFASTIHPETAKDLTGVRQELNRLYTILNGATATHLREEKIASLDQLSDVIAQHPQRYVGFGNLPIGMTYEENGEWIIVDCGPAVVHVMQPAIRQYYTLEEIWGEKPVRMRIGKAPAKKAATAAPKAPAKTAAEKKVSRTAAKTAAKKEAAAATASDIQAADKPVRKVAAKTATKPVSKAATPATPKTAAKTAASKKPVASKAPITKAPKATTAKATTAKAATVKTAKAPAKPVAAAKKTTASKAKKSA